MDWFSTHAAYAFKFWLSLSSRRQNDMVGFQCYISDLPLQALVCRLGSILPWALKRTSQGVFWFLIAFWKQTHKVLVGTVEQVEVTQVDSCNVFITVILTELSPRPHISGVDFRVWAGVSSINHTTSKNRLSPPTVSVWVVIMWWWARDDYFP